MKRKKIVFHHFVSIEMAAILDFMVLTKVHVTLKPTLQMH